MRIYLTGFMAVGKSTVGRALAQKMNYDFWDMDWLIEQETGKSINQIFAQKGEAHFRQLECDYLKKTINHKRLIISTGGGVPCFFDNMKWMNEHGTTVFLAASSRLIGQRLWQEKTHRPLVKNFLTPTALQNYIQTKIASRLMYYEQAHFVVMVEGKTIDMIVLEVQKNLFVD